MDNLQEKTSKELGTRTCRICGCTDNNCIQCIQAQGYPCHWVEEDLCSRCKETKITYEYSWHEIEK